MSDVSSNTANGIYWQSCFKNRQQFTPVHRCLWEPTSFVIGDSCLQRIEEGRPWQPLSCYIARDWLQSWSTSGKTWKPVLRPANIWLWHVFGESLALYDSKLVSVCSRWTHVTKMPFLRICTGAGNEIWGSWLYRAKSHRADLHKACISYALM